MAVTNSTERFSSRVDNYVRYRPGYPREVIELLKTECGLTPEAVVADVGSGTGIFSRLLLENGNSVLGIEPNPDMRRAGEEYLRAYPRFQSVAGTAEHTGLTDRSVDLITAAQAAHWFDRGKTRGEFARILKPGGWTALIWNDRSTDATPLLREYEKLLQTYGTDYHQVRRVGMDTEQEIESFFAPARVKLRKFPSWQEFDYAGLEGRLLSSSYTPQLGHANYEPMLAELRRIFDAYQKDGRASLIYDTQVYYGQLA